MFDDAGFSVFLVVLVSSVWKHLALGALSSTFLTRRRKKELAGQVSRITIYPVKSLKGVDVDISDCSYTGIVAHKNGSLIKDRCWVVLKGGNIVTGRQKPKMVLIVPSLHGDSLHLDAPGMDTVKLPAEIKYTDGKVTQFKVWGASVEGTDCGDDVANWLSAYLETPALRLLYHAEGNAIRRIQDVEKKWNKTAKDVDQVAYQDGFPLMLMSESSVTELNQRLSDNKVTVKQFRPNIAISNALAPFDEDDWVDIFIGDAIFRNIKPCDRCIMTLIDPETGISNAEKEPLVTLRSYRLLEPELGQAPCMGINLVVLQPGTVRLGDKVFVTRRSSGI